VVGVSSLPDGSGHAFLWNGSIHDLGTLPGDRSSSAFAINSSGAVVGTSGSSLAPTAPRHAVLWSGSQIHDLGTLGGTISYARGINDFGIVVGGSTLADGSTHAFGWNGTLHDLGTLPGGTFSQAFGINSNGRIVGESTDGSGQFHAVYWEHGVIHDLAPANGSSSARGVSGTGLTAGFVTTDGSTFLGALWSPQGDLQTFPSLPGRPVTFLETVTDSGQAAGFAGDSAGASVGVVVQGGKLYDVNTLLAPARAVAGVPPNIEDVTAAQTVCDQHACLDALAGVANVAGNPVAVILKAARAALPCICTNLTMKTKGYGEIGAGSGKPARIFFTPVWTMTCSGGKDRCTGRIKINVTRAPSPLAGYRVEFVPHVDASATQKADIGPDGRIRLTCGAKCKRDKKSTVVGSFRIGLLGPEFSKRERAGQTFNITLEAYCVINNVEVAKPVLLLTLVYKSNGALDHKHSTL
jgi:probable HAF family extracellular repeat protein